MVRVAMVRSGEAEGTERKEERKEKKKRKKGMGSSWRRKEKGVDNFDLVPKLS